MSFIHINTFQQFNKFIILHKINFVTSMNETFCLFNTITSPHLLSMFMHLMPQVHNNHLDISGEPDSNKIASYTFEITYVDVNIIISLSKISRKSLENVGSVHWDIDWSISYKVVIYHGVQLWRKHVFTTCIIFYIFFTTVHIKLPNSNNYLDQIFEETSKTT